MLTIIISKMIYSMLTPIVLGIVLIIPAAITIFYSYNLAYILGLFLIGLMAVCGLGLIIIAICAAIADTRH